ncbi:neprilysin-like [Mercenaria mercenaria]|uniref:neprilysin-like n=1 Tax=Mercenaria mercenaria TaxID=6596 RepID=UPI00234EAA19|nr:neprilysin-like [Mercenaria mercenaria]
MFNVIVSLACLTLCLGYYIDSLQPATPTNSTCSTAEVCLTPGCVTAAARVMGAMDMTVNPCDDFYNFACGTWIRKNVIPEDKSSFRTFTKLSDDVSMIVKSVLEVANGAARPDAVVKARTYYKACTNESRIEELGLTFIHQYMEGFGGWPVLGPNPGGNWTPSTYNSEDSLIYSRQGTHYTPLVEVGVMQDSKNPTKHILYIDQPYLGMPSRDYYLNGRNDETLMAYQTMIEESAVAFGADPITALNDAKDMVDMEIELANITVPREERRDPEKLYNKMTLGELSNNFTGIDWRKFINGTMQIIGLSLNDSEPVLAIAPPFLEKIGNLMAKYSPRVIANYIVARQVLEKTFYLPKVFRDIQLKYRKVLIGSATESPRWQSCSYTERGWMPEVVGRLFVADAFKEEAKTDVLDLVDKLKIAFKGMIDKLTWMENATKQVAKEKADHMEPRIGYSDIVYNDTAINMMYENEDDTLITMETKQSYLRNNQERSDMSPATVNAYYNRLTNQISFPAAILQPPFYANDQPAYLSYGGIGYVIGHEITHGFDDQVYHTTFSNAERQDHITGRLYDKNGNLNNWWTDTDAANFKARAQCIIDQYSNFTVPGTGGLTVSQFDSNVTVPGNVTVPETAGLTVSQFDSNVTVPGSGCMTVSQLDSNFTVPGTAGLTVSQFNSNVTVPGSGCMTVSQLDNIFTVPGTAGLTYQGQEVSLTVTLQYKGRRSDVTGTAGLTVSQFGSNIRVQGTGGLTYQGQEVSLTVQLTVSQLDSNFTVPGTAGLTVSQFDSNFTVPGTGGLTLNGVNSQGENIADNGAIKESFQAYREWVKTSRQGKEEDKLPGVDYTLNQLYFLNAAQNDIRKKVYGPLQNFDEFSKAWNCPVGSYMNPSNKCSVW